MKNKIISVLLLGLLFTSFVFVALIGIGGASQAVVEGVADPLWSQPLYQLWVWFLTPYLLYLMLLVKNWGNPTRLPISYRSIVSSAWLSFPGVIAAFLLVGSKIQSVLFVIPFIQILITCLLYFLAPKLAKR
jgi:hypothetical protein